MKKQKSGKTQRARRRSGPESLADQYETITGRDWYEVERRMREGDPNATMVFVGDAIVRAIRESGDSFTARIEEALQNVWGQLADVSRKLP